MAVDRLGLHLPSPQAETGWKTETLVSPAALSGANGMRWSPDGKLYVAQAFGSQISAVDVTTGFTSIVSASDGAIVAPDDLAFDSRGNLFVTEVMSARVSAIRPGGAVDIIASNVPVANGITVHGDRIFMSEFNPDGRIWELFADGSSPRLITSGLMMPNALSLGPDGMLYFPLVPLNEIWRVALDGSGLERVVGELDIPTAVKFDAQGHLFTVESGTGAITSIDPVRGTKSEFARVAYGLDNLAFSPDGRMFVSHFTDGEVIELASDGTHRVAVAGGMAGPFGLSQAANGSLIVADGMSLAFVDREGAVTRPGMLLQHGFPGYVRGVAGDPDGSIVVTNSAGQCARYRSGMPAEILMDGLDSAMAVIVASNGDIVLCDAGAGHIVAIGTDGHVSTLADGLQQPVGLAEAPDGGFFVSEAKAGRLVHLGNGGTTTLATGFIAPHGITVLNDQIFVLDRGDGTLYQSFPDRAETRAVVRNLPCGTAGKMSPNILPGIKDLMPGPLLPFADIAACNGKHIAVCGDRSGTILLVSAEDEISG